MSESIDKATATSDLLIWGVMFGLLLVVVVGLVIWDKKSREE
ncbi:MAG: hypothetical protein ACI9TV_000867 [Sulfurimonas sp.]|jgi:hypothetical protein